MDKTENRQEEPQKDSPEQQLEQEVLPRFEKVKLEVTDKKQSHAFWDNQPVIRTFKEGLPSRPLRLSALEARLADLCLCGRHAEAGGEKQTHRSQDFGTSAERASHCPLTLSGTSPT